MAEQLLLKLKGLYTNVNEFSEVPDGALLQADNIVIDKDSIGEPRRGFARMTYTLPSSSDRADKFFQFQNFLLAHYSGTQLGYLNASSGFFPYSGNYSQPSASDKIRSAEANSNFYFTTSSGITKLDSVTGIPAAAGMYPALDCQATLSASASGFLATNAQVAYRILWGIQDANSNLVLGAPSSRAVVSNASGSVSNVSLQITIPAGITTNHFFQVYRSDQSASSSTVPDDNMQLVYEANPTSAQITAKSITVIDLVPDSLRGAALYTNDTQQGILQQNNPPPFATDIALYKNCLFYANVSTFQQLPITILAVGGANGVQVGDTVTIAGTTYTGAASENISAGQFLVAGSGSAAQNIDSTAQSLIRCINQSSVNTSVYAFYLSSATTLPGQILLQTRTQAGTQFTVVASAHGSAYSPALPTSGASVSSTQTINKNGLMYSKQQIPEAVPSTNIFYVGNASKNILRIIPLRDALFILKEDGVFYCTGADPSSFTVNQLDSTAILVAPETAVALSNSIFALTTQGVVQITDSGVAVISRPIENTLVSLFSSALSTVQSTAFGIAYESDRKYILFLPTNPGDTSATQALVYNYFTRSWTRWIRNQAHGLVKTNENLIYLADPLTNYILQERKQGQYTDFSDEGIPITITAISGLNLTINDISHLVVGDMIYQGLTIASVVTAINAVTNVVTVTDLLGTWTLGSASILKCIPCTIKWVPATGQNPGFLKQWSEAILIFRQAYFNQASVGFTSDISGGLDQILFPGVSGQGWGNFPWGSIPWGGVSQSQTFRTYVPREKQRCTFLSPQLYIASAWARFQLEGLSLTYRPISGRVSK